MSGRRDLFPVGEILELPLRRREIGVVFLPRRRPHRMNQHPVAVGDGRDDAGGDVVLRRKNVDACRSRLIGLGPELRSRSGCRRVGR